MITRAWYGHIHQGRCAPRDFGQFGCYADVYHILDTRCSSQRTCSLSAVDPELFAEAPSCIGGLAAFLEVSHVCIKGDFFLMQHLFLIVRLHDYKALILYCCVIIGNFLLLISQDKVNLLICVDSITKCQIKGVNTSWLRFSVWKLKADSKWLSWFTKI